MIVAALSDSSRSEAGDGKSYAMPRYSPERKAALLKPLNLPVAELARQEGIGKRGRVYLMSD